MDRGTIVHGVAQSRRCLSTLRCIPFRIFILVQTISTQFQDLFPFSASEEGVVGSGFLLPKKPPEQARMVERTVCSISDAGN